MGRKFWEGSVNSLYLNVKNMYFNPYDVASTEVNVNQKSGKNWRMFLTFITSQIVNLKRIGDVLRLRRIGETDPSFPVSLVAGMMCAASV